jgi:hypothetical protein
MPKLQNILLIIIFHLISYGLAKAQQHLTVRGKVLDTTSRDGLTNASIIILNQDSIIKKFVRTDVNGNFSISGLSSGDYRIIISYPGFIDFSDEISLKQSQNTYDIGIIPLNLTANILKEVIIKGAPIPIRIIGDTTEYDARAYTIQPNAKVEDLLKQLPGIQVDRSGRITAQGQSVPKVLVDGEEFFGDDPTLVTKNIRADMVDVVQLFDKKSDQATFSGIDDGKNTKTINIKLKEDKNKGQFGKLDLGLGTEKYFQSQALYNLFNGKEKISGFVTGANTGKTGLNMNDNQKYGDENFDENSSDGELDSFDGRYVGEGIPKAINGGFHYENKFDNNRHAINTNYKVGSLDIIGKKHVITNYNLPNGINTSNLSQAFDNFIFRHKADLTYQIKIDTNSNLKITLNATDRRTNTLNNFILQTRNESNTLLNLNNRDISNKKEQGQYNISLLYSRRFKKVGRSLLVNVSESYSRSNSQGNLLSNTTFFNEFGSIDSMQNIDQFKTSIYKNQNLASNITYTEPVLKGMSFIFNYGISMNNNISDQQSFEKSVDNRYDAFIPSLSNKYDFRQTDNQIGSMLNFVRSKTVLNAGINVNDIKYNQKDQFSNQNITRHFLNWNPVVTFRYRPNKQQSLQVNYMGSTMQPSINQIQPLRVNNDPLNIYLGNPTLRPSFRNRFSANYSSYDVNKGQNIFISTAYYFISNQIIENSVTDESGKNMFQYSNLQDKKAQNFYLYASIGRKLKVPDVNIGFNLNANSYKTYNLSNQVLNTINTSLYSLAIYMYKNVKEKYDMNISMGPSFNVNQSSLQRMFNSNNVGFNTKLSANIFLTKRIQLNSDLDYLYAGRSPIFPQNLHRALWNASISRAFLKKNDLKFSLSINDILNDNTGFERFASGSTIIQNSFTNIQRYFMVSIYWDFNKFGKSLNQ